LTVTTLAQYRQKRKRFLSVARLILTVCRQNLSFRFEESQTVEGVALLIYQYPATITRRRSAIPARKRRRRASVPFKIAAREMANLRKSLRNKHSATRFAASPSSTGG
jgi:hypothetical protein